MQFTKSAKREFDRLPLKIQSRFLEALTLVAQNPFTDLLQIKKIKGADTLLRLRVGDYRLVYDVRRRELLVVVIKAGHRKDVYRGLP